MKTLKAKKRSILLLTTLACSFAVVGAGMWKANVLAENSMDANRFALIDGAEVRVAKNGSGIRFKVEMGTDVYDSIVNVGQDVVSTKAGMFVVPYAYVNNANAYTDGTVGNYQNFKQKIDLVFYNSNNPETNKIYQDGDYYYAKGAVVDMKFANLDLDYIGIGYIATTTETSTTYEFTSFTEANNVRNIAYIAGSAAAVYEVGDDIPEILASYVYGAALEGLNVTYNEKTQKYIYNGENYDSVEALMTATNATSELAISNATLTMLPATSATLNTSMSLTVNGATNAIATGAKFTSDNEEVATVDMFTGEVKAVAIGTANITATTMGKTVTCTVTVEDNRADKALSEADYDLSKGDDFVATLDANQSLVSVMAGNVNLTESATLEGNKLSISYDSMKALGVGEKEIVIGTNGCVYTQKVTLATYVISDKASFDTFFAAMKAANYATKDYYVVMEKNAVVELGGATYSNSKDNYFLGTFDGRGAILKDFKLNGSGGVFGTLRLQTVDTNWKDCGATLKNFAFVGVSGDCSNAGVIAYATQSTVVSVSNIYVSGKITKSGTGIIRCAWGSNSSINNLIVNVENTNNTTEALFGGSGKGAKVDHVYAISNASTLYAGTATNSKLYDEELGFFKEVTSLPAEDGWSDVWSFDNAGNLCFGNTIVMTKPDMREAKTLDDAIYQKGSTDDLTIALDAGETVTSMTVGSTNVTDVVVKDTAGQVTIPAAAIATLATGEYDVEISTANYKYTAEFVYADLVLSDTAGFQAFLEDNRTNGNKYAGQYIVLSDNITFSTSMTALSCTGDKTARQDFKGILDGRGHAVSNLKVQYHVFSYFNGATIKDIAFINVQTTKTYSAFVHGTSDNAVTVENVFISIKQSGAYGQNGFCANTYTTTNINNVVIVSNVQANQPAYGLGDTGSSTSGKYKVSNTYLLGTTKSYDILENGTQVPVDTFNTTAADLLADTTWLTSENGWNTDVWTVDASGSLCFGDYMVVSK